MSLKQKICWTCILWACLILAVIGFLASCYDTKFNEIEKIPKVEKQEYLSYSLWRREDFGKRFSRQIGHNSVQIKVPKDVKFLLLDYQYRTVDYFFFRKFNSWFEGVKFGNGIMPINQKENLDCDNFALLYKSLFSIANYKSNIEHEPAVGLVLVEQRNPFGGIPSGFLHMVNIVFCNKNWYIFEPQTGEFIELNKYPNQEYIINIII
jgi:hypothetical protein